MGHKKSSQDCILSRLGIKSKTAGAQHSRNGQSRRASAHRIEPERLQTRLKVIAPKVEGADNVGVDESQAQHRFDVLALLLKLDSRGLPLNHLHWQSLNNDYRIDSRCLPLNHLHWQSLNSEYRIQDRRLKSFQYLA